MSFDLVQICTQAEEKKDENVRFRQFLKLIDLTFTCPIVYGAMEELKKDVGFCRR